MVDAFSFIVGLLISKISLFESSRIFFLFQVNFNLTEFVFAASNGKIKSVFTFSSCFWFSSILLN